MEESVGETLMIEDLGDDIILEILSLLPAKSFASAALVCRKWNVICNCILSSPKLSSAVSLNPSLEEAVSEVVDKVLSEPIRPHFALASIGPSFVLQEALVLIERKLCSKIPIIVSVAEGVIGKDVLTDKFVEVQWTEHTVTCGIILTVGFLPGVTVHLCLMLQHQVPQGIKMEFEAASFYSHPSSPVGLILFAGREADVRLTVQGVDFIFPEDGFIVGDGGSSNFIVRNQNTTTLPGLAGVSLLFTRDINKPSGVGETEFHVMFSTGVSPVGPTYEANIIRDEESSMHMLTATRETVPHNLGGYAILDDLRGQVGEIIQFPVAPLYVGVIMSKRATDGTEIAPPMRFHELHKVLECEEEYLGVKDCDGIRSGSKFRFYIPDSQAALSSRKSVYDKLMHLKLDCEKSESSNEKVQVFGGIIFCCRGRDSSFYKEPSADISPFVDNFPGVSFGGTYCSAEIARGNFGYLYDPSNEEDNSVHYDLHSYSAVYLVMSYRSPIQKISSTLSGGLKDCSGADVVKLQD